MPVLADFEYAKEIGKDGYCSRLCGTKGYMAPEILTMRPYAQPADIWAFGTLLYALISIKLPFPVLKQDQLTFKSLPAAADLIFKTKLSFEGSTWDKTSDNLKDLIARMLEKVASKRLTIAEVIDHPWFTENESYLDESQS